MPINTESEQNTPSCSVFPAKQWRRELFSSIVLHALHKLVMPEFQFPQPLAEPVQQHQEHPPPQQDPSVVQNPPAVVQMPPQNPPAPLANDGTRGELEVLIEFDFTRSF